MTVENIELICRGDGYPNRIKPKFSLCEESVFIAKKNTILQYSTKTGLQLAKYQGFKNSVVGFDIAVFNSSESLAACSTNGEIAVWKTVTRFKSFTKKVDCNNITGFHLLPSKCEDDTTEAIITYTQTERSCVAFVNLSRESLKNFKLRLKGAQVFIGISRRRFFAVADRKKIYFVAVDNPDESKSNFLSTDRRNDKLFTCLECHPGEEMVITGDSEGQITLWQNIFSNQPARSIYHWHTLPVNCLAFSSVGSYFFSGGNESVLVRWDWENNQDKKFLPRMSGFIQLIGVSSQSQLVAVATSDNAVKVYDSSFNNISSIQHLVVGDNYECGIVLDPRTKALVMNGIVGHIQFYQPKSETLLYTMDVVGQNKLSNERNFSIENTQVTKFAISKSGLLLATVEERKCSEYSFHEMRLKFWKFDASQQMFQLNTSIEKPHQGSVLSIEFQFCNSEEMVKCVTVGDDKRFKVWQKTVVQQINVDRTVWSCRSVGFYRDLPCKALSFSSDGSLMGIGFESIVTTWTPDTCKLKCSLVYPGHKANIEHLQFGTSNQCHLIVAATKERLSVWNLLTLTMIWTVPLKVQFLLADKVSIHMAAITENREIFVFSPNSPNFVYSNDKILSSQNIMSAALLPTGFCLDSQSKWYERVEIYLINSDRELLSIGTETLEEYLQSGYMDNMVESKELSLLNSMMPHKKILHASVEQRKHLFEKDVSHKNIRKYLEAPVHTMIPIRLTCGSLIKSFLVQKKSANIIK